VTAPVFGLPRNSAAMANAANGRAARGPATGCRNSIRGSLLFIHDGSARQLRRPSRFLISELEAFARQVAVSMCSGLNGRCGDAIYGSPPGMSPGSPGARMQYSKEFTEALQFVWGKGFLSPGGPEEIAAMLQGHPVAGRRILDIGCGV